MSSRRYKNFFLVIRTLKIHSLSDFQIYYPSVSPTVTLSPATLLLSLLCPCALPTLFCGLMSQLTPKLDKDKCTFINVFERFQPGEKAIQTF